MSRSPAGALQKALRYAAHGASVRTAPNRNGAAVRCCGRPGRGLSHAQRRKLQASGRARTWQEAFNMAVRPAKSAASGMESEANGGVAGVPASHTSTAQRLQW